MSIVSEIKEMLNSRLAFKLSLVKEDFDYLIFSDKRYLLFTRVMLVFGFLFSLVLLFFVYRKYGITEYIPLFVVCFFSSVFFIVLLFKLFTHKELHIIKSEKKMYLYKKRFSKILNERSIDFSQAKLVEIATTVRRDRSNYNSTHTRTYNNIVILIELKNGQTIHFSARNNAEVSLPLAQKMADFIEVKLKNNL